VSGVIINIQGFNGTESEYKNMISKLLHDCIHISDKVSVEEIRSTDK